MIKLIIALLSLGYLGVPDLPSGMVCHVSWYRHGEVTASGQKFDRHSLITVAHKTLPFGTKVLMVNPKNGKWLLCEVQDRGPFIKGREFDLAQGVAQYLGIIEDNTSRPTLVAYVFSQ